MRSLPNCFDSLRSLGTHSASCKTCFSLWTMGPGWGHGATVWCAPPRVPQQPLPSHRLCFPLLQPLLLWLLWCQEHHNPSPKPHPSIMSLDSSSTWPLTQFPHLIRSLSLATAASQRSRTTAAKTLGDNQSMPWQLPRDPLEGCGGEQNGSSPCLSRPFPVPLGLRFVGNTRGKAKFRRAEVPRALHLLDRLRGR